jgi:hypothetical protein
VTAQDETALLERGNRLVGWLLANNFRRVDWIPYALRGCGGVESRVGALLHLTAGLCALINRPCTAELIPALVPLEGRRVELAFHADDRRLCGFVAQRRDGVMLAHVIKQNEADPGEALTFGSFRVLQVL